jgi:serine/threonine protein kinase
VIDQPLGVPHSYRLLKELFRRGMAVSYLAYDEVLEDEVLIEHVSLVGRDDAAETNDWLRQYRSIAVKVMRLRHPNHVAIRDFWTDFRTAFFLVKQYDPGTTLEAVLQPQAAEELPEGARLELCKDLLRGLAALHAHDVLHRDIKAAGIYVTEGPDRRAQIDHYHLAVSATDVYLDEQLCGTPVYLAPELVAGEPRRYTRQSDVHAAGLVCLEVLSGRGMTDLVRREGIELGGGPAALLQQVRLRAGHVSEQTIRELLPGPQADPVYRAVHPDPRERFADAQAFYESLALNAPPRIARQAYDASPDGVLAQLERLPEGGHRTDLLGAFRIATIDARMAVGKCRQIAESVARDLYARVVGPPGTRPLVKLVEDCAARGLLPPDVFTHFYNIRRQGNAALHGPGTIDSEAVLTTIGAAIRIVGWYLSHAPA